MQDIKTYKEEVVNKIIKKLMEYANNSTLMLVSIYTDTFSADIVTYIEDVQLDVNDFIVNTSNDVSFDIKIEQSTFSIGYNEGEEIEIRSKDNSCIVFSVCEDF